MVPRSVSITCGLPASRTFSTAKRIASGDKNCPFLMLTILPVCAAATSSVVCRHRKAGIWMMSATSAAIAASSSVWMSVTMGSPNSAFTSARIFSAASSPMPVKEWSEERLALRYEALKK